MRILLVEDEKLASDRLKRMITKILPEARIEGPLPSVKKAITWFQQESAPDLAFLDIQLADGLSFEIFEQIQVKIPIIFTTAYDEYAIKAFKVNSVDYLLKPIQEDALQQAIKKFQDLGQQKSAIDPRLVERMILQMNYNYKSRFIVKVGESIYTVPIAEVLYFFSQEKATYLVTNQHKRFIIDHALDQIEQMIDPKLFFRTNRKFLVAFPSIQKIVAYSGTRLKLQLLAGEEHEVLVSREKVVPFKQWLDQ